MTQPPINTGVNKIESVDLHMNHQEANSRLKMYKDIGRRAASSTWVYAIAWPFIFYSTELRLRFAIEGWFLEACFGLFARARVVADVRDVDCGFYFDGACARVSFSQTKPMEARARVTVGSPFIPTIDGQHWYLGNIYRIRFSVWLHRFGVCHDYLIGWFLRGRGE